MKKIVLSFLVSSVAHAANQSPVMTGQHSSASGAAAAAVSTAVGSPSMDSQVVVLAAKSPKPLCLNPAAQTGGTAALPVDAQTVKEIGDWASGLFYAIPAFQPEPNGQQLHLKLQMTLAVMLQRISKEVSPDTAQSLMASIHAANAKKIQAHYAMVAAQKKERFEALCRSNGVYYSNYSGQI
jgi:hypothetical protein